jgi:predicted Rossmann fold nucleotide-binding protein DprA/Smf involved in DNA uptake
MQMPIGTLTPYIINKNDLAGQSGLENYFGGKTPEFLTAIGNRNILKKRKLAVFSSIKCPGQIILKTYDYFRRLKGGDIVVISGFHSPMEKECLQILLINKHPVIICPARSIKTMRIKKEYKNPLENETLLLLSPFNKKHDRISAKLAEKRNLFISAISDYIFVPYAAPRSKTASLCEALIKKGKNIKTFHSKYNKRLIELGVETI